MEKNNGNDTVGDTVVVGTAIYNNIFFVSDFI